MHEKTYVGTEHFTNMMDDLLAGGHTLGHSEAAATFVEWIGRGFPDEINVMGWAGPDGSGSAWMRASDIVESAVLLLPVPLPMPDNLAVKVRAYVTTVPIVQDEYADERGAMLWVDAIWDLKHALAWRQEHDPA